MRRFSGLCTIKKFRKNSNRSIFKVKLLEVIEKTLIVKVCLCGKQ